MKIIVRENAGSYSKNVVIKYNSKSYDDKKETDKYISRILPHEFMLPDDEDSAKKPGGEPKNEVE